MIARALCFAAAIVLFAPSILAQDSFAVQTLDATLPATAEGPAAAALGGYIYVFGGYSGRDAAGTNVRSDQIVRFDPSTGQATVMGGKLPNGRHGATVATVGDAIYIFGGSGCFEAGGNFCATVFKYVPATDTMSSVGTFGIGFYYMAAAAVGDVIYIAGGENLRDGGSRYKEIWRLYTSNNTLGMTQADLPVGLSDMGAAAAGGHVYFFGGCASQGVGGCQRDWIFKYDPVANTLTELPATLPKRNYGMSVAADDTYVYLFGGQDYPTELDSIVRFNPANNAVSLLRATLTGPRYHTAAAWVGDSGYIFGGAIQDHTNEDNTVRYDEILKFSPATGDAEPTIEIPKTEDGGGIPTTGALALLVVAFLVAFALNRGRR